MQVSLGGDARPHVTATKHGWSGLLGAGRGWCSNSEAMETDERAKQVKRRFKRAVVEPKCELDHDGAWQLLIATILSAQCTDARVNMVTPKLFARFSTPAALALADVSEVETLIKSTGTFRMKAKRIIEASATIVEDFGGEVPRRLEEITRLPGVARKTGNLVLGVAYGIASGMVVDTHAGRVARRLGLTEAQDPVEVERDLTQLFHARSWIRMSHTLVLHGRYVCKSAKPRCSTCPLYELCPSAEQLSGGQPPKGRWTARADAEWTTVQSRGNNELPASAARDPS